MVAPEDSLLCILSPEPLLVLLLEVRPSFLLQFDLQHHSNAPYVFYDSARGHNEAVLSDHSEA